MFGTAGRELSEKDGLKVPVCNDCHNMGDILCRIHGNPMAERMSKIIGQLAWEKEYALQKADEFARIIDEGREEGEVKRLSIREVEKPSGRDMDVRICRKEEPMEYMRTQASIEKFVIITMRDGRKKYVGRRYSFKMDCGYTVKINEAMMFDTEKLAERKMEELRIKGQIGKVVKSYELKEIF